MPFDDIRYRFEAAIEDQGINVSDRATDDYVVVDGTRHDADAFEVGDTGGITLRVPGSPDRTIDWSEIEDVTSNDDHDVILHLAEGTVIEIASRIIGR